MKLEELLENVPEPFRPIAARYGQALVKMTAEEFCAWVEMLILGRSAAAWGALVEKLDDDDLLAAWRKAADKWDAANTRNSARIALGREAAMAVLKVLLGATLAMVGL